MRKLIWLMLLAALTLLAAPALAKELTFEEIHARVTLNDSKYTTIITPDTLNAHSQFLLNKSISVEDAKTSWEAEGILCQAWNEAGDVCVQITAVKDQDAEAYFDIDQQTVNTRAVYRKAHLSGESFDVLGIDYSSAEWKKTNQYGRFLMLQYSQKIGGEIHHRGYARKTIRNGYTIMVDYQIFGRGRKASDDTAMNNIMKTWYFDETLPMPAGAAPKITVNNPPPEQTNSAKFTYEGAAEEGMVITAVITRMAANDPMVLTDTVNSKGRFEIDVRLPQEGVYLMTVTVERDGVETESLVYPLITYDKTILPVNFENTLPKEITTDKVTISGTSIYGVTVQCIVGEENKSKKVGTNKEFSFSIDTSEEGEYQVVMVFSKKGLDTQRFTFTGKRTFSLDDIKEKAREEAVKPAYKTLTSKIKGYTGRTMVYTAYVTKIENVNGEWLVHMAMNRSKTGEYKNRLVVTTLEEPTLTVDTQVKFYGECLGTYDVLTESEGTSSYPMFQLLFWDR